MALYGISLHAVHQTELTAKLIQKMLVPRWMLGCLHAQRLPNGFVTLPTNTRLTGAPVTGT